MSIFRTSKIVKFLLITFFVFALLGTGVIAGVYYYLTPKLPSTEGLRAIQLQVPLRVYSSDGALMGEFGEKRRSPKKIDAIPVLLQQAFLASEDDRFYSHPGVDVKGILRAALNLALTGKRGQGGSTITMQLARNFYLSREKSYLRKLNEILLALKIERELTKHEILELYLNKIYLGNRTYGVAAAAQLYYGVALEDLTLAHMAMIAGLPKAPSAYNPIINPKRAIIRRNYVLTRMLDQEYISQAQFEQAKSVPVTAKRHRSALGVYAPYINEMVRAEIVKQFGETAYTQGLKVFTTVKKSLQQAANESLWNGLVAYDKRHGYRGVVRHEDIQKEVQAGREIASLLKEDKDFDRFVPGIIVSIDGVEKVDNKNKKPTTHRFAVAIIKSGEKVRIPLQGVSWAKKYKTENYVGANIKKFSQVFKPGDVVWLEDKGDKGWFLAQVPKVQGALVSLAPNTGEILALTGGLNFERSKFNRAIQAKRQAGSGFKPIIYSAALDKQYTPASLINDAPVVFESSGLEGDWRPENYSGRFFGPTRLRKALYKSRNLVSVRILRAIGIKHALNFAKNFGLKKSELPRNLSLALGSAEVTPLQMSRVFSVFANGGYLIEPYFIERIIAANGDVLFEASPVVACPACLLAKQKENIDSSKRDNSDIIGEQLPKLPKQAPRTLEPRLAYQINSILKDVIAKGTGVRAKALGRHDLAGKTGTTNEQKDAWFNGYNPDIETSVWVGFDKLKPLGSREAASHLALPIWMSYMKAALAGKVEKQRPQPDGLVTIKINAETGLAASDADTNTIYEVFRQENVPAIGSGALRGLPSQEGGEASTIPEQIW